MFAPSVFCCSLYPHSVFPTGIPDQIAEERRPESGVKKKRYWRFEEGLPYPVIVEELRNEEDKIVLQAYLDRLREEYKPHTEVKVDKETRLVTLGQSSDGRRIIESNNNVLFLMAALDFI